MRPRIQALRIHWLSLLKMSCISFTVNWFNEQFTWNQIHRLYNISRIIASRLSLNVICFKLNHKWLNYKTMKLFIYLNVVAQSVRVSVLISSVVTTLRWQGECGGQRWWWGRSRGEYTGRYGLRVMSPCTGGYKEYLAHLTLHHKGPGLDCLWRLTPSQWTTFKLFSRSIQTSLYSISLPSQEISDSTWNPNTKLV